jgi:hypothetical protein
MLCWLLYGALTLMRTVPRTREPPRWLMRFGLADLIVLSVLFAAFGAFVWL